MKGYIHDPLQIINLIADNIRDRYKTGFSVIKEIIQNADDAGGDSKSEGFTGGGGDDDDENGNGGNNNQFISFEFGLSLGLSNSDHPLLKGPALFFFNNGRFMQSDAIAIRSFGLNRKAIDEATIGKFGLGMKSVFHFCEAFFFLAQDQDRSYTEILNPWSGPAEFHSLHADWNHFSNHDAETLKGHLGEIIGPYLNNGKSWFLLWLPLRSTRHTKNNGLDVGSIVAGFPGDDLSRLEFLKDPQMPRRLARLLPLLRRIVSIRFWEFSIEADRFETVYRIFMESPDNRTRFPARPNTFYTGQIQCENGLVPNSSHRLTYAGLERQLNSELLKNLMGSEFWPRSYVRDESGQSLQAPDKAQAHCSAVFSRCRANDGANIDVRWAVFLPVETGRESIPCNGEQSYCLTLHGYFFIDAGRAEVTGILPSDRANSWEPPANETELRRQWNGYLSRNGTLRLLIPALVEFANRSGMNQIEMGNLCQALHISTTFSENREAICCTHQLVFRLKKDRVRWARVKKEALLLPLPAPPAAGRSRPWNTLGSLDELDGGPIFIQDDEPHLLALSSPPSWTESLLDKVLDIDVSSVFQDAGKLNYLCLFLSKEYTKRLLGKESIQSRLKSILRSALIVHGQNLTQFRSRFREITAFVFPTYRLAINATWSEALNGLLQCETTIVLLPREMDALDSPGKATLNVDDAVILFRKIDKLFRTSTQNSEVQNECRQLSNQIFTNVPEELLPEVLGLVRSEKIIEAFDCPRNRRWLFSIEQLMRCQEKGLLFLFSQGTTDEQRLYLAPSLQQTIYEKVLVINTYNAKLILGAQHGLIPCNPEGSLKALGKSPLALTGMEQRKVLIRHLAGALLNKTELVRGMRYLLHGRPEHFENDEPLWTRGYQQGAVWEKMWRQLPENNKGDWNLLDRSLIEHIPQNSWSPLGIREINLQEILNRFREVGFDGLDKTIFSRTERETVLIAAENNGSLWRKIPFHEALTGQITSITDQNVFLESNLQLPREFHDSVTIVRRSENERVRDSQLKYIPVLNDEVLIRILVESQQPHRYWREIMDALQRTIGLRLINRDLCGLLRERCWLIDTQDTPVRPSDVIHLPPIADEVCRLSIQIKGTYVALELLHGSIREHPYWSELASKFFAAGDDGLDKLGLLLEESPAHAIGEIRYDNATRLKALIDIFRDMPVDLGLPGWNVLSVVESAYGIENCDTHILPNTQRSLSIGRTIALLEWLKNRSETCNAQARKKVIDAYECYLDVFVRTSECRDALPGISLLNAAGRWRCASELCADAQGVAREDLIHDRQKGILRPIIQSSGHFEIGGNESPEVFEADVYAAVAETAERVKVYFALWEDVIPPNLIRAFLSLLGDDNALCRLAASYEGSHSIVWIRTSLPWVPNTHRDPDGRQGWLYQLDQHEAIKSHRFIVEPVPGQTIQVRSICGSMIDARLSEDFDSLIVGGLWYERPRDSLIFTKIRLRQIDVEAFSPERLSAFLRKTCEYLLRYAYCQIDHDLESFWSEIGKGEQLDIRIAQLLVIKHIPYYLRQLGAHRHLRLTDALKRWNDARYRVAEFSDHPEKRNEHEKQELEALKEIQNLLVNDQEVQQTVLEAVRSKIMDFQYTPASILFELFQNADDAVVELAEIRAYPNQPGLANEANLPASAYRFVLRKAPGHLYIMHWGRAVNHQGGSGFPGRERGFHQDLEKMLILSSSDKSVGESEVTGKFGLGFKSVFLISDVPKLVSGRLQADILGGMYPKRSENAQQLRAMLGEETSEDRAAGTLIHLPLDVGDIEDACEPFEKMAGILAVFSKQIRKLEIGHNDRRENHEWAPTIAFETEGAKIEYGMLSMAPTASAEKVPVLHFRFEGGGGLLVGIGPQGLRELPDDLPAIWVVAPTHEDKGIGFAINGRFEVDAGRARLSNNDESTSIESRRIGDRLAKGLLALFDEGDNDWDRFRERLCLGSDLRPYDFWASVWQVLNGAWGHRLDGKVEKIVMNVMTDEKGLGRLVRDRKALPTGLWGDVFQTLTCIGDVKHVIRGALSQDRIFKHIASWEIFRQRVKPSEVISSQVFEALRKVNPAFSENNERWQSLKISSLLNWLGEDDYRITPATASVLGQVITPDFLGELKATSAGQNEAREISGMLRRVKFQTKPGGWREARFLLVSRPVGEISKDEPLRAAFAPQDLVLSDAYDQHGVAFFTVCRGKMEAPVEDMAAWVLDATGTPARQAALRYLLDGELGDRLATYLRNRGLAGTWLEILNKDDPVFEGWDEDSIDEVRIRKLRSLNDLRGESGDDLEEKPPIYHPIDPRSTLTNVQAWWHREGSKYLAEYDRETYPEGKIPDLAFRDDGIINRENWLTLFVLAACHTFGLFHRRQHKGFIGLCKKRGWWATFAAESPETRADQWMGVLDKYIDEQVDESKFEIWMRSFPSIYRIARYLDEYAEAFCAVDRVSHFPSLDMITQTKSSAAYQGGGISAPPVRRTFGIGACFIVRELKRSGIIKNSLANPHCYVPLKRVRRLMSTIGCPDLPDERPTPDLSIRIHEFISSHLGENEADFEGAYDIPLQILAENEHLQRELFGWTLKIEDEFDD